MFHSIESLSKLSHMQFSSVPLSWLVPKVVSMVSLLQATTTTYHQSPPYLSIHDNHTAHHQLPSSPSIHYHHWHQPRIITTHRQTPLLLPINPITHHQSPPPITTSTTLTTATYRRSSIINPIGNCFNPSLTTTCHLSSITAAHHRHCY